MNAPRRYLIVNADDFGLSDGVNRGIARAHEDGVVTSASLMVRGDGAHGAAAYARAHPRLSVGLHLDLGEWIYRDGEWRPLYEVVPLDDEEAIGREIEAQLAAFRALTGTYPSHLDSHQHVHQREPTRSLLLSAAEWLSTPVRGFAPAVRYSGAFYGQTAKGDPLPDAVSVDSLLRILRELSAGITELGCHPGEADDLTTAYRAERRLEVEVLCDPRIRAALDEHDITLCSYGDVATRRRTATNGSPAMADARR
jgi:chitin disaccharide deacetylase